MAVMSRWLSSGSSYPGTSVIRLVGFLGLHTAKPNQTRTGVCSNENKDLLKERAQNLESQVSCFLRPGSLMASRDDLVLSGKVIDHGS